MKHQLTSSPNIIQLTYHFAITMSSWLKHMKFRVPLPMLLRNDSIKSMALKGYPFLASSPHCHFYPHFPMTLCMKFGKISSPILFWKNQFKILRSTKAVNSCHLFGKLWAKLVSNPAIQSHPLSELQPWTMQLINIHLLQRIGHFGHCILCYEICRIKCGKGMTETTARCLLANRNNWEGH